MRSHSIKIIILILILTFFLPLLSGCTKKQSINNLAYVIGIGLDVGSTHELKLSIQISKTNNPSSDSGSSQSSDAIVNSVECSSIASGLNLFNSYLGKEVNLSHCKVVVISEGLASLGISEYIYTLLNDIQLHNDANVIISKSTAEDFLNNSTPILEQLSAKYYEITSHSSEYTGYTDNITLGEFFSAYTDTFQEAYAILGGINSTSSEAQTSEISADSAPSDISISDNSYVAGQIPIKSDVCIDTMGLAVFDSDKFVGELTGIETICHMLVINRLTRCIIRIPSPINNDEYLDLNIALQKTPELNVYLLDNSPYITVKVSINARLLSITEDSNDLNEDNKQQIENQLSNYLEENIKNYLYKTAKKFNSDIVGFGKYAVKNFKTWNSWMSYNWRHKYRDSFFKVDVQANLRSGYLLLDT